MLSSLLLPRFSINRAAFKDPTKFLPADVRGYCVVPDWLEEKLQHWEDPIIKVSQRWFLNIVCLLLSRLVTSLSSLEVIAIIPVALFVLGKDFVAVISLCYATSLLIISQLSKRLIWRYRPYMVSRAIMASNYVSSSFSSVSVSCAVVYVYMCCEIWAAVILNHEHHVDKDVTSSPSPLSLFVHLPVFILTVSITIVVSCVKVATGANYPSDCICGVLQGILVCYTGSVMYTYYKMFCAHHLGSHGFLIPLKFLDWSMLFTWSIAGVVVVTICSIPKLLIIRNLYAVAGMLTPCLIVLQAICNNHHVIKSTHSHFSDARSVVIAAFMCSFLMGVSNYMRPMRWWSRVLCYVVLHCLTLSVLLLWKIPHK